MSRGLDHEAVTAIVQAALFEDAAGEDVTVSFLKIGDRYITAKLLAQSEGVLCGMDVAKAAFFEMDPKIHFDPFIEDGGLLRDGQVLARIDGSARGILGAERVALNFLQRMSGIATLTSRFVEKITGTGVKILDTRKTTPLLRALEKYAVATGGGENHRFDLKEQILIKENHTRAAGGIEPLIERLRSGKAPVGLEVEVDTLEFLDAVLGVLVDRVMLDNFSPEEVREAVGRIKKYRQAHPGVSVEVEVSGGVTLENVADFAIPGVDFISIGALTHSAPGLNLSIEVD